MLGGNILGMVMTVIRNSLECRFCASLPAFCIAMGNAFGSSYVALSIFSWFHFSSSVLGRLQRNDGASPPTGTRSSNRV